MASKKIKYVPDKKFYVDISVLLLGVFFAFYLSLEIPLLDSFIDEEYRYDEIKFNIYKNTFEIENKNANWYSNIKKFDEFKDVNISCQMIRYTDDQLNENKFLINDVCNLVGIDDHLFSINNQLKESLYRYIYLRNKANTFFDDYGNAFSNYQLFNLKMMINEMLENYRGNIKKRAELVKLQFSFIMLSFLSLAILCWLILKRVRFSL